MTSQSRRRFLVTVSLAGAAGLLAPASFAAEEPLETTSVRLTKDRGICFAPQSLAEALLFAEGFTEVRYLDTAPPATDPIAHGKADFSMGMAPVVVTAIDRGEPITVLAGVHAGCLELFANQHIGSVADLKGKTVAVPALRSNAHMLLSLMTAQVGVDPSKDIHWVSGSTVKPIELFVDGKIDALMSTPPESIDLRAQRIGHVILNTTLDRPWSQYFCCVLAGNRDYVRSHPVATKRVLRAILKAADLCVGEPQSIARQLVDRGFTARYDYAYQALSELPFDRWRDYDAEDSIRFYALRMREAGFIKSSPQKIIADGTDWRFLDEVKRELKA